MMLRSFIAVEIPPEIQSAIARSIVPLQNALSKPLIRWVAPQNVHLTIKFLGDVSPDNLERLAEALRVEIASYEIFSMKIGELGAFPTPRRARIIWIGLDAPTALTTLIHGVEAVAAKQGYASEDRPFSPHLTIGRVRQNLSAVDLQCIRTALEANSVGELGTILVDSVHIYKSVLQPSGAVYTHLFTIPMKSTSVQPSEDVVHLTRQSRNIN